MLVSVEQLLLVVPSQVKGSPAGEMTVYQWSALLEQFAAQGGREVLLSGGETLGYPSFWVLVRKAIGLRIPRVSACMTGNLLEPWVIREVVSSGVHVLVTLDSLTPEVHDGLRRGGAHGVAMAGIQALLAHGMGERLGIVSTATRLGRQELPALAQWAAEQGLSSMRWSVVPEGGWSSPQAQAARLTAEEVQDLAGTLAATARSLHGRLQLDPLDQAHRPGALAGYAPMVRVHYSGEAHLGSTGEGMRLGNARFSCLEALLSRVAQAAGD